jgi:hypothetical protein
MTWQYFTDLRGYSPLAILDQQFTSTRRGYTVLTSLILDQRVYYAAVEHRHGPGNRTVFAAACPIRINPRPGRGFAFGYKLMTEDAAPFHRDCPARILDLLTPTERAGPSEWRLACRRHAAQIDRAAGHAPLRPGQVVEFERAVQLPAGGHARHFRVAPYPHSTRVVLFEPLVGGPAVRITALHRYPHRVVEITDTTAQFH